MTRRTTNHSELGIPVNFGYKMEHISIECIREMHLGCAGDFCDCVCHFLEEADDDDQSEAE